MKKYVKYFIFVMILFVGLFVNINGVDAANSASQATDGGSSNKGACSYGIVCSYSFCGDSVTNCPSDYQKVFFNVAFRCSDTSKTAKNCDSFVGWAEGWKNNRTEALKITFSNYNDVFHNIDKFWKSGFRDGGFYCPQFTINGSGTNFTIGVASNTSSQKLYGAKKQCIAQSVPNPDISADAKDDAESSLSDSIHDTITGDDGNSDDGEILDKIEEWGNSDNETKYSQSVDDPCNIISGDLRDLLHEIFLYISIAGIIILVAMTSVSLVKVITASEDNALSNFLKGLWKRIICLIILLLLPMIITFVIQVVNGAGKIWGVNSDNPLCSITE